MKEKLEKLIADVLKSLGMKEVKATLEHPTETIHGDWSTNVALVMAKDAKISPKELAEKIKTEIEKNLPEEIERAEIAGPGFINFFLSMKFFAGSVQNILEHEDDYGRNAKHEGEKIMIEYTDPNPFKEFHIGHLMNNTIGETISRIIEFSGAEVRRANYQGDVGLHVAKAIAGMFQEEISIENIIRGTQLMRDIPSESETLKKKAEFLGSAYAQGATAYEQHEDQKKAIGELNKLIYERSNPEINKLYDLGRAWSLEYFEDIYKKLGTNFDFYFFESESGKIGRDVVKKFLAEGKVFEESEGAIVFRGEKYDPSLHTRVFITSEDLPTYEAKELGLAKIKFDKYAYGTSITVAANEVDDYFRVVLKAMELVYPDLRYKTKHVSHGMLRLPTGKMSSRTGEVIVAEDLIREIEKRALDKIETSEKTFTDKEKKEIAEAIAIGAIKYSILKQSPGKDIIFDIEKSLSFEGDSGPYLQYTYTRALSDLEKAGQANQQPTTNNLQQLEWETKGIEKLLYRFPEVVARALDEYEPQHITGYLIDLAQAFNTFYGKERIVDPDDETSPYKVALTQAVAIVLKNGLWLLGIFAPSKM